MSRTVPRRSRSDQPFSCYSQKSLDTQTSYLKYRSQTPSSPPTTLNSALFYEEGAFEGCTCARARCTPPSCVVHHRITVMELCRCTNFHVACSKYLEVRGLPTCTCVARAQCTTRPQVMYQRIALVKLFQCTKFRVATSKFPKSEGAYAYS